jgi:nucleoside-diphosphate-sugar epimerase
MSGDVEPSRQSYFRGTRRCLVTGGSGFIGTHLLEALVIQPGVERVVVLDLIPPKVVDSRIEYWECDLRRAVVTDIARYSDLDTCYHLAAVCKEPGFAWDEYFESNYAATRHLGVFLASAGIRNLLFTSTTMVFRAGERRMDEAALTSADTAYGMSKALAEEHLLGWQAALPERRLRIVRPGVVFGRGEDGNYTRLFRALKGRRFVYVGRRTTVKGCIYVKDVVRVLGLLTDDNRGRTTYNLVYPDPLTIEQICRSFCAVLGLKRWIPVVPFRLALALAYLLEVLGLIGVKTSVHHRRIEKLYYSTNVSAEPARALGVPQYALREAIADWWSDCGNRDLY